MQSIISKGKTTEEAIRLGLQLMEVTKQEVDIEVIQQETNGFIGVGKKQAVVRLSKLMNVTKVKVQEEQAVVPLENIIDQIAISNEQTVRKMSDKPRVKEEQNNASKLVGKAWVKDNQIHVIDAPSHYSTVTIGKGVKLYKNGELVKQSSTVISEKDQLQVQVDDTIEQPTKWDISMDQHKVKAMINVEPGFKITQQLQEVEPSEHIELNIEEIKTHHHTLEYKAVLEKLEAMRIVYGFNHSEIMKAVNSNTSSTFEIATGKNADPGKDGWIELKVDTNPMNGLIEDESGKVDFRETNLIPTVEKGSVAAVIHPPIPGRPGITVTNEPLPAKQTYPINLICGNGMIDVGDRLVATESGRPSIEIRGHLVKASIVPKLMHYDNVNLASGNIRFTGDVEIVGEVEENMLVEADGDIFIHKAVNHATLTTSKSIVVKGNVFSSELAAGKSNMLIVELGHLLGNMHQQLEQMIVFIKQLMHSPAFKSNDFSITGLQPLIRILLEKRFKNFVPFAKKYQEVVEKGKDFLEDEEWIHVGVLVKQIFLTLSNQVTTLEKLNNLSQKMEKLSDFSEIPVEPNAYITISDTINSSLYCSGDISIIGKGCINTKVHAGGQLNVKGIVRGGEVYGRLGVSINEAGSTSGAKTIIAVPADQKILLGKVYEGTVLKIGNVTYHVKEERKHLIARLDRDDKLIME